MRNGKPPISDSRLAVRSRGGLAALESGRSAYLRGAFEVLSALSTAKLYVADWPEALQPQVLFPQRATVADWIGSEGTDFVLSAIAKRGGPEWVPWLEQMASAGKISWIAALAASLGCGAGIPTWGQPHLDDLFRAEPWVLRAAAAKAGWQMRARRGQARGARPKGAARAHHQARSQGQGSDWRYSPEDAVTP